jgi:hypothetical protein
MLTANDGEGEGRRASGRAKSERVLMMWQSSRRLRPRIHSGDQNAAFLYHSTHASLQADVLSSRVGE